MHLGHGKLGQTSGIFHRDASTRTEVTIIIKYDGQFTGGGLMAVTYAPQDLIQRSPSYDSDRNLTREACSRVLPKPPTHRSVSQHSIHRDFGVTETQPSKTTS